jgi:two-component system sensor histidine kinase YesM
MTQVGRAEVLDHLVDGPSDEIGLLVANFRSMVGQIDGLLEAQYRAGQDLKSAELKALQAQINPHFLSNTLEMINWQALNKGVPEIAEVSRALARFYALSLNNGRDVVTLADEVAHTETYVEIQNRRFGHRIDLRVRVPKTYLRCEMPKILLQPLVENAILHGILERGEDRGGTITVSARRDGGDLLVTVADDGVGMDPARAASLLTVEPQAGRHGYGVKNIDQRVRLFAGEGHGLSFTSRPGRGTKAVLRLAFQVRNSVR